MQRQRSRQLKTITRGQPPTTCGSKGDNARCKKKIGNRRNAPLALDGVLACAPPATTVGSIGGGGAHIRS
eukprot:7681740-Pyramimonas_sp.AAC.1